MNHPGLVSTNNRVHRGVLLWAIQCIAVLAIAALCSLAGAQTGAIDFGTARLSINDRGAVTEIRYADGAVWPASGPPMFAIETATGIHEPQSIQITATSLVAQFTNGSEARFSLSTQAGFALFRLVSLTSPETVDRLHLFQLQPPAGAQIRSALNAGFSGGRVAAVQALEPNVHAFPETSGSSIQNRAGCTQDFTQTTESFVGKYSARYAATCNEVAAGWTVRQTILPKPINLHKCTAVRAWVSGDNSGAILKFQLQDGKGGYLDTNLTLNFTGPRQVTLAAPSVNTLDHSNVAALAIYYNSLPANRAVACVVDQIEVIAETDTGTTTTVLLEDFENTRSPWWYPRALFLKAETLNSHSIQPAAFGIIACAETELPEIMDRFEQASGLPNPRSNGAWMRKSPLIQKSYLFLTDFGESQFNEALALAQRGGFGMVLIVQSSWSRTAGHYEINPSKFPGGQIALAQTIQKFQQAGFKCGLHILAPSLSPADAYVAPVPDPRLVKSASVTLAADVSAQASYLPLAESPALFPAVNGDYDGQGTIVQCGSELIRYTSRKTTPPYGLEGCQRGYHGTTAAAHSAGAPVSHLLRSYSCFLFDMDTNLLHEVAANVGKVANACNIDMLYFDNSERLQGDHWYYNAKLHKAFWDQLTRKDVLLQASSYSHYSWHLLSRAASADGHGDLKGYLEERSPIFPGMAADIMPLDIGWYYGYDHESTPDQYEYILGATIGYGASVSFQVSVSAANTHPFTGEILDLIRRYETLRLSGRVSNEMRGRLRIDSALGGKMTDAERAQKLALRRDYRLIGNTGQEQFQRARYEPWQEIASGASGLAWDVNVLEGPAKVGFQVHARTGLRRAAGSSYSSSTAMLLEGFEDLAQYGRPPAPGPVYQLPASATQSVSQGVTQDVRLTTESVREGKMALKYTATSTRSDASGWSYFARTFSPSLNLSACKGTGLWMRGDGKGGLFKIQLTDGINYTDRYIRNDYTGWAYHQFPRTDQDAVNYANITTLGFYYNGLPASATVSCLIDGVKILNSLDNEAVVNPWIEVDGKRLEWSGALDQGQYVMLWPGEQPKRYGQPLQEAEVAGEPLPVVNLSPGLHRVTFGASSPLATPARVRLTLQPPERWPIGQTGIQHPEMYERQ